MGRVFDDSGMENGASGEEKPEGAVNGTQVNQDPEVNEAQPQPGEESGADGGAEGGEAREGAGGDEVQAGTEEGKPDPVATLQATVADLQKKLEDALANKPQLKAKEEAPKPPVELTEEEWAAREQALGIPRNAIKWQAKQGEYIYKAVMEGVERILNERMGGFEKSSALSKLSKETGFEDAGRYQKEVDEFLADFSPEHHSNPALLKKAVVYARGLNAKRDLSRVRSDGERNKVISGSGRPAAPSAGNRVRITPLNLLQKQAAQLMGSEAEYNKWRPKNGSAVIER